MYVRGNKIMRRLLVAVLGVIAATAVWAIPAFAAEVDPTSTGYIEICKTLGSPGLVGVSPASNVTTPPTASFAYTVTDGPGRIRWSCGRTRRVAGRHARRRSP